MYREEIAKKIIKSVIPQRLDIGDGFIITSTGTVSTQCDLIIYDKNNSPLIENTNKQRFFPIECVVAVGEIKSDLSKKQLKEALIKLKNIKELRNNIPLANPFIFKDNGARKNDNYNPEENVKDEILTFIICNKIRMKKMDYLVNNMDDIYENADIYLRHNMILSIDNGLFMYKNNYINNTKLAYPCDNNKKRMYNSLLLPGPTGKEHIIYFLNNLYLGTSITSIMYPEMANYIENVKLGDTIDEKL